MNDAFEQRAPDGASEPVVGGGGGLANDGFSIEDLVSTGPDTPAGRYLRLFWHPVYHSADLAAGHPVPLRVMSQSFTLYRGESGQAYILDHRCPHRGAQMSSGRVEGDELRCGYHGWKFASDGTCIEQPPEENAFCHRVKMRNYPVREHLGLIFAYLGEGDPPEFDFHPQWGNFEGFVEIESYLRECNYFQNLENALDMSHVAFTHGDNVAATADIGTGRRLTAKESDWGVSYTYTRPDGESRTHQFGMPNRFYFAALPTDGEIGWQETVTWFVPVDDQCHVEFLLHRVRASAESKDAVIKRRLERRRKIDLSHQALAEEILAGRLRLSDVDTERTTLVNLQDNIAQIGQGRIADRSNEHLGRGDIGVIAIRRLWLRELTALRDHRPVKNWKRTSAVVPTAWALPGGEKFSVDEHPGGPVGSTPLIVDLRAEIETDLQLRALHGAPRYYGPA